MARKVQLKNKNGEKAYPVTSSELVKMSSGGGNLDGKLTELEGEMYNNFPIKNKYYDPSNGNETSESTRGYAITGKVYIKGSEKIIILNSATLL